MNCRNCGAPLNSGTGYCSACGKTIREAVSGGYVRSQQPYQQNQQMYGGYPQNQQGYQQNQQAYPPNQQMYGGYPQNQQVYGGYPPQNYGGYPPQGYRTKRPAQGASSALKTFLLLFMAAAMILSTLGLLHFPFVRSSDSDYHIKITNANMLCDFLNLLENRDGDLGETLEYIFDDEDSTMVNIGFFASVILLAVTMIFYIIGLIMIPVGNHSGSAGVLGVGAIITTVGYILVMIEGISYASETNNAVVSLTPIFMILVTAGFSVLAFISAGKLKMRYA